MRGKSIIIAVLAGSLLSMLAVPLRPTVVLGQSMAPTLRSGGFYVLNTHGSGKLEGKGHIRRPGTSGGWTTRDHKIWAWRPNQPKGALQHAHRASGLDGFLAQARICTTAPSLRERWVNTGYYRRHSIKQGDVVVFRHSGETCTKRVYALPGQHVLLMRYDDNVGNEIVEGRQADGLLRLTHEHRLPYLHLQDLIVPPGCCFVVGDNRPVSYDSRSFGCISMREILGHVGL